MPGQETGNWIGHADHDTRSSSHYKIFSKPAPSLTLRALILPENSDKPGKNGKIVLTPKAQALIVKALWGNARMSAAGTSRILLCGTESSAWDDVRSLLEDAGHAINTYQLNSRDPENLLDYNLVLLQGSGPEELKFCRRLRLQLADSFIPILYLTGEGQSTSRLDSLEAGVDAYLQRPFAPRELLAQVQAFLRIKELHDRLLEKTAEVNLINKRLEAAHRKVDQELELARRIQQSFLPQSMPEVPHARLAVLYLPCGRVGGDFYDAFRLDENHFGFYVADAMGHGVPASLLTIFLKRGVRAKEIIGKEYRLVPPSEVLQRLNRDLVDQSLADNPFITMVYALFNPRDRRLRYSRAGHPYPLYIPGGRRARALEERRQLARNRRHRIRTARADSRSWGQSAVLHGRSGQLHLRKPAGG
jgi:CheY-like chemotaxis protein